MARQKIGKRLVEHLDNYTKAIGFNLGKIIKEAHQGAQSSDTRVAFSDDFLGDSLDARWNVAVVGTTPTAVKGTDAHTVVLTLDTTDEAESARLDWNAETSIDSTKKPYLSAYAKFTRSGAAASYALLGLASDYNSDPDAITRNAWFKFIDTGTALSVVFESDDNTTNTDDQAINAITIANDTVYKFAVDMSDLSNVKFLVNDILVGKTSMAAVSGGLQPYVLVGKASGASAASVTVDYVKVECNR